jgi:transposase-like protein
MEGYAMSKDTTAHADVIHLRQNIQDLLRRRVLEAVQTVLEEELSEALGSGRHERSDARQGYRNGHETRRITTCVGTRELEVPRGRIVQADDGLAARKAQEVFLKKWEKLCPAVVRSYQEAGLVLNRAVRADPALRPDRIRADSDAENPWPSAPARARCTRRNEGGLLMQHPIVIRAVGRCGAIIVATQPATR